MASPKTVQLFLMDGTPTGRIKCSLTNWIGVVYSIPRTDLAKCRNRDDLKQTGVYILLGTDEDTGKQKVYVGQARERKNGAGVLGRIIEHVGEEKLDYFTHALVIITNNDSFGATEISYLENALYNQAAAAGRVLVVNGNDPSAGNVTEEKQAELDEFISFAQLAIGSLGIRLFDAVDEGKTVQDAAPAPPAEPLLFLKARGASGRGRQTTDGFVVLAGSKLREKPAPSCPEAAKKNREKYADRISPEWELTQDTLFTSPSAASDFLMGGSTSGKAHWKDSRGMSLRELEWAELDTL